MAYSQSYISSRVASKDYASVGREHGTNFAAKIVHNKAWFLMILGKGIHYSEDSKLFEFPDSAVAVHVSRNGEMLFVRQRRPLHGRKTIELPGGRRETGETEIDTAKRELLEETGFIGTKPLLVASIDLDFSASAHVTHIVRFDDAEATNQPHRFERLWVPLRDAMQMIEQGVVTHAPSVIAVTWELIRWKD
jgi:ADP-ribose pyrophosphatase